MQTLAWKITATATLCLSSEFTFSSQHSQSRLALGVNTSEEQTASCQIERVESNANFAELVERFSFHYPIARRTGPRIDDGRV